MAVGSSSYCRNKKKVRSWNRYSEGRKIGQQDSAGFLPASGPSLVNQAQQTEKSTYHTTSTNGDEKNPDLPNLLEVDSSEAPAAQLVRRASPHSSPHLSSAHVEFIPTQVDLSVLSSAPSAGADQPGREDLAFGMTRPSPLPLSCSAHLLNIFIYT